MVQKEITKFINIEKAIQRLLRERDKMIYYNEQCYMKLMGREIPILFNVLEVLRKDYEEHKHDIEYNGIKVGDIVAKSGRSSDGVKTALHWLMPLFIFGVTKGEHMQMARKYKLNENGIKLIEQSNMESEKDGV